MSADTICDVLRQVPLFAQLPIAELQAAAKTARLLVKKKAARICEEGSVADCCYVLTSGRLKVVLSGPGDVEFILAMLEPFAVIGEIALLDNSVRSAGLVAVEDSRLMSIPRASFQALRRNVQFEDQLVAQVTSTLRRATEQLRAMYTFGTDDRLAWCLARIAAQRGQRRGDTIRLSPKPPQHELADMTGCSRETVSRALARLKRKKWLSWDATTLSMRADIVERYYRSPHTQADVTEITRFV